MRPRLLDLFCGSGGAGMGYSRAGFDVTGVDIVAQKRYPFEFHQADALDYVREHGHEFDVIHASPPCQRYSARTFDRERHADLIPETRDSLIKTGKVWVIENVPRAPLIDPVVLCGSSFELRVRRHRLFESPIALSAPACDHEWQNNDKIFRIYDHKKWFDSGVVAVYGTGGRKGNEHWKSAMGIDWMTHAEIVQAIPPAYTEFIGRQLMEALGWQP